MFSLFFILSRVTRKPEQTPKRRFELQDNIRERADLIPPPLGHSWTLSTSFSIVFCHRLY